MDNQNPDNNQTVTINIPADSPQITQVNLEGTTSNTQEPTIETPTIQEEIKTEIDNLDQNIEKAEEIKQDIKDLSTDNPQEIKTEEKKEEQPKPKVGRPCKYCQNKEYYQKIVDDYITLHKEAIKPTIPWVEELALKLNVDDGTLVLWAKKEKDIENNTNGEIELEHPELHAAYTILKSLQKLRLKQRALGRFNPHGALYLLNADHKVIQTNKTELGNSEHEPLKIEVVEVNKNEE